MRARPRLLPHPAVALGGALLLCLAGCSSSETGDGTPAGSTAASPTVAAPVTVPVDPPSGVRLLSPGSGAKRRLSYAPTSRDRLTVEVSDSSTSSTDGQGAAPTQTATLTGRADPGVDGAQRVSTTVDRLASSDPLRERQFATTAGFELGWTRTPAGAVTGLSYAAPSTATDVARAGVEMLSHRLADTSVVLPSEPIGVGARWAVTRPIADAVAPTRVVTYELTALDGDRATVRFEVAAPDPGRTLRAPSADGTSEIALDVRRYEVAGAGALTVDLRGATPVDGTYRSTTKAAYVDPRTGTETASEQTVDLAFRSR